MYVKMIFAMNYRKLTTQETQTLREQHCKAENWDTIYVDPEFTPDYIQNVEFSGKIKLGVFNTGFVLSGGLKKHSGIRNACLHNCEIGDNVLIENVQNHIANYKIGKETLIRNLELMYVEGESSFGNGVEVNVLSEAGGREVMIHDKLTAHFAYILSFYRHRPLLIQKMQEMVKVYTARCYSDMGVIGENVIIRNVGTIKNVNIGSNAVVEGTRNLENGTISSNGYDPVHIGYNVIMKDFIVSSGSAVEDGTMLTKCFVGQACHLGHTYSANDSLFFSNCRGENGEACAIFAGPYTVTHHKSTLLIAGMFSFMNAGSGSNQSNHMYKLGPIHQGIMERGSKTTSDSYVLWPARIGAFSLVMGRHYRNSDTSSMPFSYIIECDDESYLIPGINLRSVGIIRDAQKFPKRDRRKDPEKLDKINFKLLSPYTVQKVFQGVAILKELKETSGETSDSYIYHSCIIKNSSLKRGLKYYDIAINKFLGSSLISRLKDCPCESDEQIREYLRPNTDRGLSQWCDLAGLLVPCEEIDKLINEIEEGKVSSIEDMNLVLEKLHIDYSLLEWAWTWNKIEEYYNLNLEAITAKDIIGIIERWRDCVVELDNMIYEDAKKEFSLSSQIGFGMDGNKKDRKTDFEQVRGVFEENPFVRTVLKHIDIKTNLGDSMIGKLRNAI